MPPKGLSSETVSLVQHVELNKAGWWGTAERAMILSAARDLCLAGRPPSVEELTKRLAVAFHISIPSTRFNSHVSELVKAQSLLEIGGGLKVTESALREMESNLRQTQAVADAAKDRFAEILQARCPDLGPADVWPLFNDQFLTPLVRRIGVNTYRLMSGLEVYDYRAELTPLLENFPTELHSAIKASIESFLDPGHTAIRSYVLSLLNAYFVIEASGLTDDALQRLGRAYSAIPAFNLFLDTNFLFSILGLHENPSNEAAVLLAQLIRQVSDKVLIRPYVLPCTIDEAKRVIDVTAQRLAGVRLTPNLAEGAIESGVSGMAERFAQESRKVKGGLRADDYFGPYLRNLVQVVRTRGVELFNEDLGPLRKRQDFIDDLNSLLEHEQNSHAKKPKGYEQVEHDLLLWYFVQSKRPALVESPLEGRFWVVTVDFRFLAFDSFKRRHSTIGVPICVHPTTLTQMLQFWVPRSVEFEKAMLGMMRLPLLFQAFDLKAEQVTIRILDALGRFESVQDLPVETVNAILTNEALRTRMKDVREIEDAVALVSDALIAENRRWRGQFERAEKEARALRERLLAEESHANEARGAAGEIEKELGAARADLERSRSETEAVSSRLAEGNRREVARRAWIAYLVRTIVVLGVFVGLLSAATILWRSTLFGAHHPMAWAGACSSLLVFVWVWYVERVGQRDRLVAESAKFKVIARWKAWLMTGLGIVAGGTLGNAVYDLLKRLVQQ